LLGVDGGGNSPEIIAWNNDVFGYHITLFRVSRKFSFLLYSAEHSYHVAPGSLNAQIEVHTINIPLMGVLQIRILAEDRK
jgi:hypothetical protein